MTFGGAATLLSGVYTAITAVGDPVAGDGYCTNTDGRHLIAIYADQFLGRIFIEATLELKPKESDWFTVPLVNPEMSQSLTDDFNYVWDSLANHELYLPWGLADWNKHDYWSRINMNAHDEDPAILDFVEFIKPFDFGFPADEVKKATIRLFYGNYTWIRARLDRLFLFGADPTREQIERMGGVIRVSMAR